MGGREPGTRCTGTLSAMALLLAGGCAQPSDKAGPARALQGAQEDAADAAAPPQRFRLTASAVNTRFVSVDHFLAGGEMQLSGEPFAQAMGRTLTNYSRDHLPTDIYFDSSTLTGGQWIDVTGFSTAIESYEYSKQAMNETAFESGAGTSLLFGPVVNPTGLGGLPATALVSGMIQHFGAGSNALGRFIFPVGTFPVANPRGGATNPTGAGTGAENPLGWPGIWPTVHVFRSFDPAIKPTDAIALGCAISSDDDPGASGSVGCADYECDATTLHLPNRDAQVEPIVSPGADGFSAWKYALWVLNYLQSMHDAKETAVSTVPEGSLGLVGAPQNAIVGTNATGALGGVGTYLGSSDIEGFQAQMFIAEVENQAQDWLMHLSTTDGKSLSGFASLNDALNYDYVAPLRWFPGAVAVTEMNDGSGFPHPTFALSSADSHLLDQSGLILGYSEFFSITDRANRSVGGSQPALAFFDGDPFPADDQKADGEPTLHDRALGVLRVALVNLDRLHTDPSTGWLVDDVVMNGSIPSRGTTVSTTSLTYSILALRTALRSLTSQLQLYSNNSPDTAFGASPFDAIPIHLPASTRNGAAGASTLNDRMWTLVRAQGDLLLNHLTSPTGQAWSGWDFVSAAPSNTQDTLDAHTAAIRGLFAEYLITSDTRFRDRAVAVFNRLQTVFYDEGARIYTATPYPVASVEYTPLRFALLQSALRDMYILVAARPGGEALVPVLEERVGRLNKLVLNGWDDRNQNRIIDYPGECVNVQNGLPRGGLQMAERTLTGETGSLLDKLAPGQTRTSTSDREHDCVPEIDDARLPASLASSITFQLVPQ